MAANNIRKFLSRVKNSGGTDFQISPINTPSSLSWTIKGNESIIKDINFLNNELIYYVQEITLPPISFQSSENVSNDLQQANIPSMKFGDSLTMDMTIVETKTPIIEQYFRSWMLEAKLPEGNKGDGNYAYTYANVYIEFNEKNLTYCLYGVRPTSFETVNPSQQNTSITRKITFSVDFIMGFPSKKKSMEDNREKFKMIAPETEDEQVNREKAEEIERKAREELQSQRDNANIKTNNVGYDMDEAMEQADMDKAMEQARIDEAMKQADMDETMEQAGKRHNETLQILIR